MADLKDDADNSEDENEEKLVSKDPTTQGTTKKPRKYSASIKFGKSN